MAYTRAKNRSLLSYRKDTEPLYPSFMYSLVSLLSSIYPLPAMHALLVTLCDGILNSPYGKMSLWKMVTMENDISMYHYGKCHYGKRRGAAHCTLVPAALLREHLQMTARRGQQSIIETAHKV